MSFDGYEKNPRSDKLGLCPRRLERITSWLEKYVDDGKLPFAAVVVMRKGQVA